MKILLLISLFLSLQSYADDIDSNSVIIVAQTERSNLSNNYASHDSNSVELTLQKKDKKSFRIKSERVSRYDTKDSRAQYSFTLPISDKLLGTASYTKANNGVVIPKQSLFGQLVYSGKDSYVFSVSNKKNKYNLGAENTTNSLEIAKYLNNYRLSYAHNITDVKNARSTSSNKITAHYFYDKHYVATALSHGQEAESLSNGSILLTDVESLSIYGEYWPEKKWGLRYSINRTNQGDLYVKKGASVAVIHRF